jgi:hypothetical protein
MDWFFGPLVLEFHIVYGTIMFKKTDNHGIDKLNKDFESRIRLGLMSVLMVNDWIDFTE